MSYPYRKMETEEIAGFLDAPRHAIAAMIREKAPPLLGPVWYLFEDSTLYFSILSGSYKYRSLAKDPHVSICVDGGHPDARSVVFYGTAEMFRGSGEQEDEIQRRLARRYLNSDAEAGRYLDQSNAEGGLVLFTVTDAKVIARDYN